MPLGIWNVPQVSQRKMDNNFKKHYQYCLIYIEGLLVFSKTKDEHANHLEKRISRIWYHPTPIKMEIRKDEIEYLGMILKTKE